jgi:hypothetical protein
MLRLLGLLASFVTRRSSQSEALPEERLSNAFAARSSKPSSAPRAKV